MTKLRINRIYKSLQGEGDWVNTPTAFIRFQGCNLFGQGGCKWCDTQYATYAGGGSEMTIEEVMKKLVKTYYSHRAWVCITGGEPLAQLEGLVKLVQDLKVYGYRIEVETNGTLPKPSWYTQVDSWCVDVKCPSSGILDTDQDLLKDWFQMRGADQIKFVVADMIDLEYADFVIRNHRPLVPSTIMISPMLQPGWEYQLVGEPKDGISKDGPVREWLQKVYNFCIDLDVNFNFQIHKLVWGDKRGV